MTDDDPPPEVEASIAAFQAAVIDADVEYVGHDPEYTPDCPRLQRQMGKRDGDE